MSQTLAGRAASFPCETNLNDDLILDFRTITTMLEILQQMPTEAKRTMELRTKEDRQELRVLSALATLLVRRFEVTAVATGGSSSQVSLVACASDSRMSATHNPDSPFTGSYFTTTNPPRSSTFPRLIVFDEVKIEMDASKPLDYVHKRWDKHQPFQDHAQALINLLQRALHSKEAEENLLKYVIAKSFQKMHFRMKNTIYSADLLATLTYLNKNWDSYNPKPPSMPTGAPEYSDMDENFLDLVPLIPDVIENISIPYLTRLAENFQTERQPIEHLYTKDTYQEIHNLLCELFIAYQKSLRSLKDFIKKDGKQTLADNVASVALVGVMLHTMAYGSFLGDHFEGMSDLLNMILRDRPWEKGSDGTTTVPIEEHEHSTAPSEGEVFPEDPQDDPELLQDSELVSVQPRTRITDTTVLTVAESFHKWSRLMVSYFEAVKTVIEFIKKKRSVSISMTVVALPHQGRKMKPWSHLVKDQFAKFITVEDLSSSGSDTASFTSVHRFAHLPNLPEVGLATDDDIWATKLTGITSVDDFKRAITYILSKHSYFAPHFCSTAPLSMGDTFKGTVHCEAGLASLQYARNTRYDTSDPSALWFASNFNSYIGISKWCCPVCDDLLALLRSQNNGKGFQVAGAHRTVYACTLPPWLPREILAKMNKIYWNRLLETLFDVVQTSSLLRPTSSGSHATSSISNQSKKPRLGWKNIFGMFKRLK